eukprot:1896151-Pleurochrysis_carterae.AAC.1
MEQMMKRIVAREEASHDVDSVFARAEARRLQQQVRKCKLKYELADAVSTDDARSMIHALQRKQALLEQPLYS